MKLSDVKLFQLLPFTAWIGELKNPKILRADLVAGVTVTLVLIPQAILVGIGRSFDGLARLLEVLTFSRWGFSAQRSTLDGGAISGDLFVLLAMTTLLALATCVWLRLADEI